MLMVWFIAILAHFDDNLHYGYGNSKAFSHIYLWSTAFCILGLFFTRSRYVVIGALWLHVAAVWHAMPVTDNHWWMSAFVSCTLLLGLLYASARNGWRNGRIEEGELDPIIPAVRWIIILLYFFAVFHKLNSDFFDPNRTCAVHFFERGARELPYWPFANRPGLSTRYILIGATLLLEGAPALFLSFRRTWYLGILFGATFHLTTGLFMRHFPSIMLCLYFAFVPKELSCQILATIDQSIRKLSRNVFGLIPVLQAQALFWTFWSFQIHFHRRYFNRRGGWSDFFYDYHTMLYCWFLVMAACAVALVWLFFRFKGWRYSEKPWLVTRWHLLYALPFLFFLNGASPYLGFNKHPTMAMWSNLFVEGGHSNHWIVPAGAFTVFPYTDDLVTIHDTNEQQWKRRYVQGNRRVAFSMLKRSLQKQRRDGIYLRYTRRGKEEVTRNAEREPEFAEPEPYWFKKLIYIKDPPKNNVGRCRS